MFNKDLLQETRKSKGLKQEELGNIINVTKVSICCYEKGTRIPSFDTFSKLCLVLDLEPNELCLIKRIN